MRYKVRLALATLGSLLVLLVLGACGTSTSVGDRVVVTQGAFDQMPLEADEALKLGWIDTGECVPNMGRHFLKMAGDQPGPLLLLYDTEDDLIGVELESVSPQPAPPWEHLPEGHPGMEFEHWTLHMYFSDPAEACKE